MYICTKCNKEVNTQRSYVDLMGKPVCRACQLEESRINKFGSLEAWRKSKAEATKRTNLAKYGVENVSQVKEIQQKKIDTSIERYGVESPNQAESVKKKKAENNFRKYGTTCAGQTAESKAKREATNLEKYGVKSTLASEVVREKIRQTNIERYGVSVPMKNSEVQAKARTTVQKRYGVDNVAFSEEISRKKEQTNLKKYGANTPFKNADVQNKIKTTLKERYGVEHTFETGVIRDKANETIKEKYPNGEIAQKRTDTMVERYGVGSALKSDIFKEKAKNTNLERYGVENPAQNAKVKEKTHNTFKVKRNSAEHIQWRINVAKEHGFIYLNQRVREDGEVSVRYRCPRCNMEFEWCLGDDPRHVVHIGCKSSKSVMELQVRDFVREILHDDTIDSDRKVLVGKELDIYVPKFNIAIEFDGIYWHDNVNNTWKFEECAKKGIRLIRITEYEWVNQREKIESVLKSAFGIYDRKIFARKCEIREISSAFSREFLEDNHLQGNVNATVRLGLFYKGELVEVETFGKRKILNNDGWELLRECSRMGVRVIGGKSKLLKHFIREYQPKELLSFCERDKFSGKSYESCGFKLDHISKSSYKYYKGDREYLRFQFQKHKLKGQLEFFDENMTEWENMERNGFSKLFDYGNYVYRMDC